MPRVSGSLLGAAQRVACGCVRYNPPAAKTGRALLAPLPCAGAESDALGFARGGRWHLRICRAAQCPRPARPDAGNAPCAHDGANVRRGPCTRLQYDQPVYDQLIPAGMGSRYAATNIAFASLVSVSMGVLFSASPYADWSSAFLFAVYLLNVVSTLGRRCHLPDRGQRLLTRLR